MTSSLAVNKRRAPLPDDFKTRVIWWATVLLSTLIGFIVIGWVIPVMISFGAGLPSPRKLHNNAFLLGEMSVHALAGALALLIGPWQLLPSFRAARPQLHRYLGRVYVAVALASGVSSLFLLPKLHEFGTAHVLIFMGGMWIITTILGVVSIRQHDIEAHRRWMLRSYSLAWGAVSIRLFTVLLNLFDVPLAYKYPATLWLALLTNVFLAEIVVRRTRMWAGPAAPARRDAATASNRRALATAS